MNLGFAWKQFYFFGHRQLRKSGDINNNITYYYYHNNKGAETCNH